MPVKGSKDGEGQTQLNIDNVVSSHWEIEPTIPDGGFGWIVVVGSLLFQVGNTKSIKLILKQLSIFYYENMYLCTIVHIIISLAEREKGQR